jgi:hypothetical protein
MFNICFNLEPIWFESLHFFSLMEGEYIPQHNLVLGKRYNINIYDMVIVVSISDNKTTLWNIFIFH